ncbi:MAG: hypothetical protein RhofKO_16410 [Rhodothermales bacterium]
MQRIGWVLGVMMCVGAWPAWAQTQVETGITRDVNRYEWLGALRVQQQVGPWAINAENRFTSDAFLLFDDQLSFRDENQLRWTVDRPISSVTAARLRGRTAWFSQNRVFTQEALAGLRVQPSSSVWIEPALGFAWDQRPGIIDANGVIPLRLDVGPAYGVRTAAMPQPQGGYQLQFTGEATQHLISPRRGHVVRLQGMGLRQLDGFRVGATVGFAGVRRDAYQAISFLNRGEAGRSSESVEATTSDTLLASIDAQVPLSSRLQLTGALSVQGNNRYVETQRAPSDALFFDTDFRRRSFDIDGALLYQTSRLTARIGVQTGAEVEERTLANRADLPPTQAAQKASLLQQADYDRGFTTLSGNLLLNLGQRTTVTLSGTTSLLRHDTPEINPDDRDEVLHNGQFGLRYQLSPVLAADVRLSGNYYHTIYLKASRSAENNVLRALRLRPALTWQPSPQTRVRFGSTVRATYTVDDFVLPGRRAADQSARELRYEVEAEHAFDERLRLRFDGSLSDLRLGRFLNDSFAEIPFDTLRTYAAWVRLEVQGAVTAEIGLRAFIRTDFSRAATVRYPRADAEGIILRDEDGNALLTSISRPGRERIEQIGPTCSLAWPMRRGSVLRFDGWLNIQHIRYRLYGELPEASATRIERAARVGRFTLYPNFSLSAVWRL